MTIQMLHTVLHDGERIPAWEVVTGLPRAVEQDLVASGAAKAHVAEIAPASAAPTKPEPEVPESSAAIQTGKTKGK